MVTFIHAKDSVCEVLEVGDSRRRSDGRDRLTLEREKRETMRRAQSKNNPSKSSEDTKEEIRCAVENFPPVDLGTEERERRFNSLDGEKWNCF